MTMNLQDFTATENEQLGIPGTDPVAFPASESQGLDAVQNRPLSPTEHRVLFNSALSGETAAPDLVGEIEITGSVDETILCTAIQDVMARHPLLRALLSQNDRGNCWSVVPTAHAWSKGVFAVIDGVGPSGSTDQDRLDIARTPIPLDGGVLWRALLVRSGPTVARLILVFHQIIADVASIGVFARDLECSYTARSAGQAPMFGEALDHQEGRAEDPKDLAYWAGTLRQPLPHTTLLEDFARPARPSLRGDHLTRPLDATVSRWLHQLCTDQEISAKSAVMAATGLLLARLAHTRDVVIGTGTNGSAVADDREIGHQASILPLRLTIDENQPVAAFLSGTQATLENADRHRAVGFDAIVHAVGPKRDLSRNPLFQVLVDVEPALAGPLHLGEATARVRVLPTGFAPVDLSILVEVADPIILRLVYATDLYRRETIEDFADRLITVLERLCETPDAPLADISVILAPEQAVLESRYAAPKAPTAFTSIPEMIARSVAAHPDKPAVRSDDDYLSYGELDDLSNSVAAYLADHGVGNGTKVGIYLDRTPEVVACLLGVLKLGAIYVPIDTKYPAERVSILLHDAPCAVCLVNPHGPVPATLPEGCQVLTIDETALETPPLTPDAIENPPQASDIAYLIYTSGSTGLPKGIRISHGNVVNLLEWTRETYSEADLDCVAATTSLNFDMSVFEIFGTLAAGGTLLMLANALEIFDSAVQHEITLIDTVPSAIEVLLPLEPDLESCRVVNLGGEALPRRLCDQIYDYLPDVRVYNLYGPSETTTFSTIAEIPKSSHQMPNVGVPVRNTDLLILNEDRTLTPLGSIGELYIGGTGVTQGYLNRPQLTAEKYVTVDWVSPTALYFKTGDLVSWGRDDELRYHGRIDHQVKVRGHRVELGEIDAALAKAPGVDKAATVGLTSDDEAGMFLAAYYTGAADPNDLKTLLARTLPDYMVPRFFIQMEALPLNPNGKLDRPRLPAPTPPDGVAAAPQPGEEEIAAICQDVLGLDSVDRGRSFFDLGGRSVDLMQVVDQIRTRTGATVPLADAYAYAAASLRDLARLTNQAGG